MASAHYRGQFSASREGLGRASGAMRPSGRNPITEGDAGPDFHPCVKPVPDYFDRVAVQGAHAQGKGQKRATDESRAGLSTTQRNRPRVRKLLQPESVELAVEAEDHISCRRLYRDPDRNPLLDGNLQDPKAQGIRVSPKWAASEAKEYSVFPSHGDHDTSARSIPHFDHRLGQSLPYAEKEYDRKSCLKRVDDPEIAAVHDHSDLITGCKYPEGQPIKHPILPTPESPADVKMRSSVHKEELSRTRQLYHLYKARAESSSCAVSAPPK